MSPNNLSPETDEKIILDQIIRFSRQLHDAGINVNLTNLIDVFRCIKHIDLKNQDDFYSANCASFVSNQHELPLFDRIYHLFWQNDLFNQQTENKPGSSESNNQDKDKQKQQQTQVEQQKNSCGEENRDPPRSTDVSAYSPDESLMKKDLGLLTPGELEKARKLISELILIIANRKSRRLKKARKGRELFFREMFRRNASHGQDGLEILFRNQRIKRTRLLLLCDVSGSMERYSRFLIHIIYAMYKELNELDVAVFSTHMTMITEYLKGDTIDDSLDKVAETAHDWSGGTNIGQCFQEFNQHFSREISTSHSIVVILSDGWDQGDAKLMENEMKKLHKSAYKILWLNPLLASDSYQPLCQGMRTALPYIDYFLPAHNLDSFAELISKLRQIWR